MAGRGAGAASPADISFSLLQCVIAGVRCLTVYTAKIERPNRVNEPKTDR